MPTNIEHAAEELRARLQRYCEFLKSDPANPSLALEVAELHTRLGEFAQAESVLATALANRPADARLRSQLATDQIAAATERGRIKSFLDRAEVRAQLQALGVDTERGRIKSFLDRAEVRAQLQALGVDASAAHSRVDALTDDEAQSLAARIDGLPAGGDSVLGFLFLVFIILLITDILGLTKVFPFTRPVRR